MVHTFALPITERGEKNKQIVLKVVSKERRFSIEAGRWFKTMIVTEVLGQ